MGRKSFWNRRSEKKLPFKNALQSTLKGVFKLNLFFLLFFLVKKERKLLL